MSKLADKLIKNVDLTLILPCFNEELIFADSVEVIKNTLDLSKLSYEIIFVDDGSRDKTPELIKLAVSKNTSWEAIYHKTNKGRGKSVVDGIGKARGKVVGYIDIDLEVSPIYIPQVVKMIIDGKADFVIGRRVYKTSIRSIIREILSVGYQRLVDMIIGINDIDTESGYKFFDRKKILPILSQTAHPHWFWDTEIVVFSKIAGLRIKQIPVLFIRRFDKRSSVRLVQDTLDYMVNLWKLKHRIKKDNY